MRLKVFAVRDAATDQYGTPMFLMSSGQAIRSFGDEVNRAEKDNQLYTHPDDFELFELGEYETDSGKLETNGGPQQVATGKRLKVRETER